MKSAHTTICLLSVILMIHGMSNAQPKNNITKINKSKEDTMTSIGENKKLIHKLYEQSLNAKNMELLKDFISEDYIGIGGKKGIAAFEEPFDALFKAFPDIQYKIEEMIGEGDKIVTWWKWQGTHTGQFRNFVATGKQISNEGMAVFEIKGGKIINSRVQTDRLDFLQQLELIPRDLALLSNKKTDTSHIRFIDKFFVPSAAKKEFLERVSINRNFISSLPGFIEDIAYERTDEHGNLVYITIATWQNEDAIKKAMQAVQAEYKKQGFDRAEMYERLKITIDRGIYKEDILRP